MERRGKKCGADSLPHQGMAIMLTDLFSDQQPTSNEYMLFFETLAHDSDVGAITLIKGLGRLMAFISAAKNGTTKQGGTSQCRVRWVQFGHGVEQLRQALI